MSLIRRKMKNQLDGNSNRSLQTNSVLTKYEKYENMGPLTNSRNTAKGSSRQWKLMSYSTKIL
jgi:hypothetical protein